MTMPIRQAQNLVEGCIQETKKVSPGTTEAAIVGSNIIIAALTEVRNRILRLIAGGYKLDRLRSTLLLCNEAIRMQEEIRKQQGDQKARLNSLLVGLNEVQS